VKATVQIVLQDDMKTPEGRVPVTAMQTLEFQSSLDRTTVLGMFKGMLVTDLIKVVDVAYDQLTVNEAVIKQQLSQPKPAPPAEKPEAVVKPAAPPSSQEPAKGSK
jgi:hypothetical protein